jgi:hypothetical protein
MKPSKPKRQPTKKNVTESAAKKKKVVPNIKIVPSIKELLLNGPSST